jgi:uncharacterized protein
MTRSLDHSFNTCREPVQASASRSWRRLTGWTTLLLMLSLTATATEFKELDWLDLLPEHDKQAMLNLPEFDHDSDGVPQDLPAVLQSTDIRKELDKNKVRIAGFVVPVEYDDAGTVTEFFLVPYFGACIHVPPPPPNQIIYVSYKKGLALESITEPYWISGVLKTESKMNEMALSSYTLDAEGVIAYQF